MSKEERRQSYINIMPLELRGHVVRLDDSGFFDAPASTKYHGAYDGGLFDHSLAVTEELVKLTERLGLEWSRPESPYIVGMFHDLCKVDNYLPIIDEVAPIAAPKYVYNPGSIFPDHGAKSVIYAQRILDLTDEEIACIRWHMGAYEKDPEMWRYYDNAIARFPNVLYTHTADMIASKIREV